MWTDVIISIGVLVVMAIVFVFGFVAGMIWVCCMEVTPNVEFHDCDDYLEFLEGNPAFTFRCSKCNKRY